MDSFLFMGVSSRVLDQGDDELETIRERAGPWQLNRKNSVTTQESPRTWSTLQHSCVPWIIVRSATVPLRPDYSLHPLYGQAVLLAPVTLCQELVLQLLY